MPRVSRLRLGCREVGFIVTHGQNPKLMASEEGKSSEKSVNLESSLKSEVGVPAREGDTSVTRVTNNFCFMVCTLTDKSEWRPSIMSYEMKT